MSGSKTVFVCQSCGSISPKWLGRCPVCGEYNTIIEEQEEPQLSKPVKNRNKPQIFSLKELFESKTINNVERFSTGMSEFDRVLGGGAVRGSVILLGGEPGIGKSTLIMQTASSMSKFLKVFYVTGEESVEQLRIRAERLQLNNTDFKIVNETDLEEIKSIIENEKPEVLIIDSIQTLYNPLMQSSAGSVSQIREITRFLSNIAKQTGMIVFVIGHITKDGTLAGPKILEHMVDCVLTFEGEEYNSLRILRTTKNRYGATCEIGVFEMLDTGLREVQDASQIFLDNSSLAASGSALSIVLEGSRPLVVEVQSLSVFSPMVMPRRVAGGIDYNRLSLISAVLDKMTSANLRNQEIYTRISGGLRVEEPSIDLAVAVSILSSFYNVPVDRKTVFMGELGLNGFIKSVRGMDRRLAEAARQSFSYVVTSTSFSKLPEGVSVVKIEHIKDIVNKFFSVKGA